MKYLKIRTSRDAIETYFSCTSIMLRYLLLFYRCPRTHTHTPFTIYCILCLPLFLSVLSVGRNRMESKLNRITCLNDACKYSCITRMLRTYHFSSSVCLQYFMFNASAFFSLSHRIAGARAYILSFRCVCSYIGTI